MLKYLERSGHTFVVASDKDGPGSLFERELPDADVVISQPFWPAYLTAERIAKAKKLKLAITAGIGSDHVDLQKGGWNIADCVARSYDVDGMHVGTVALATSASRYRAD